MKTYQEALLEWQRGYIITTIMSCHGSMIEAAQQLGINRTHFYRMCDRLGIKRTDQRRKRPETVNKGNAAWQELGRQEHAS